MSVELKIFGGAYFVKDKALKKDPSLKPLAIAVKAANKGVAETIIAGKLAEFFPANIDDYFKAKVWEDREELPCPELNAFCSVFFDSITIWNVNTGEPATAPAEDVDGQTGTPAEKTLSVSGMSSHYQAAALALFGPLKEVDGAQYGQIVDLTIDDEKSPARELYEAINHNPPVLHLHPETQVSLLEWVRGQAKPDAQWPALSKLIEKWLAIPADKRPDAGDAPELRTDSGVRLSTGVATDRHYKHTKEGLGNEIAKGFIARDQEFNIYNSLPEIFQQAEKIRLSGTHEEFEAWYRLFITTPGGMDFSSAINIAVVKTAPPDLWKDPVKHREYFNRVMTESDHANPDPLIVDIACGRSSSPMPGAYLSLPEDDQTKPPVQDKIELPAVCPGRAAQLDKELNDTFEERAPVEQHADEQPRIENLGGGVFSVDALLQPNAPTPKQEECKKEDLSPSETVQIVESVNQPANLLTYQQQLTLAALQGLCANPAYCGSYDDLPGMADWLATSVIQLEGDSHA